jgi:hypothetical protein
MPKGIWHDRDKQIAHWNEWQERSRERSITAKQSIAGRQQISVSRRNSKIVVTLPKVTVLDGQQ